MRTSFPLISTAPTTRAGVPNATEPAGRSRLTRECAPTMQPGPIVTPIATTERGPMKLRSPMTVGARSKAATPAGDAHPPGEARPPRGGGGVAVTTCADRAPGADPQPAAPVEDRHRADPRVVADLDVPVDVGVVVDARRLTEPQLLGPARAVEHLL